MLIFRLIPLLLCALSCTAHAWAGEPSREDQFKAAYLFNFLKFVEWPASVPKDVLTICFVGADGVYDTLAAGIEGKRAGVRRLAVRRLEPGAAAEGCQVVYAEANAAANGLELISATDRPILTVSDASAFAQQGGMIELFTADNRLRFSINVNNAQRAGLRISSNLLQLAARVQKEER